ncbi:3D domain-containing protein [Pseudodesulfovibrio senegalensis]|jgi:3D (Asp-Asp-Asp) domain-containing protein|nr:3D domain-containing protein [Pseudodesulfovibrio senegalensis]
MKSDRRMSRPCSVFVCFVFVLVACLSFGGCNDSEIVGDTSVKLDQNGFPVSVKGKVGTMAERDGELSLVVVASAYTLRPQETKDYAKGVAAWGDKLKPGMKAVAVSRDLIPLGLGHNAVVTIRGLSGKYRVLDKMNKRWKRRIDILFGHDLELARKWGKRKVVISWPAP